MLPYDVSMPKVTPLFSLCFACAAAPPPRVSEPEALARTDSAAASEARERGDLEAALALATRALVRRLARCGFECPAPAYSFVQLGDLRLHQGHPEWAAQSYWRALSILEPHAATHARWIAVTRRRLDRVCAATDAPACRPRP